METDAYDRPEGHPLCDSIDAFLVENIADCSHTRAEPAKSPPYYKSTHQNSDVVRKKSGAATVVRIEADTGR